MVHYDLNNFIFIQTSQILVYSLWGAVWDKFFALVKCLINYRFVLQVVCSVLVALITSGLIIQRKPSASRNLPITDVLSRQQLICLRKQVSVQINVVLVWSEWIAEIFTHARWQQMEPIVGLKIINIWTCCSCVIHKGRASFWQRTPPVSELSL